MEVKLDSLIEKIRKDGIEKAQKEADAILKKAEQEAAELLEKARREAESIRNEGKEQAERFQENAERSIRQAARDSRLLVKNKIMDLLNSVFKQSISDSLSPDFLQELIMKLVSSWNEQSLEIVLSPEDKSRLEKSLFKALKGKAKENVELKLGKELTHGFRVGVRGSDVYYDFSDEAIAEMLRGFLNPRINEILDRSDG